MLRILDECAQKGNQSIKQAFKRHSSTLTFLLRPGLDTFRGTPLDRVILRL